MEIGIVDPDVSAVENGVITSKVCNQQYLVWLLGKYLDEIAVLDKRLANEALWQQTPQKQESRQKRLEHLREHCLPFVSLKIQELNRKRLEDFRDLFEPL